MGMDPLGTWLHVTVEIAELLRAHFPGSEPLGLASIGKQSVIDFTPRSFSIAAMSSSSSSTVSGSNTPVPTAKKDSSVSNTPFRSSATALLNIESQTQNMEIRKILFHMFDLIEV